MKNLTLIFLFWFSVTGYSQEADTLFIVFDDHYEEMAKAIYLSPPPPGSVEKVKESVTFYIRQMEKNAYSGNKFAFAHSHQSKEFNLAAGRKNPEILIREKSFLKETSLLGIDFFRTTPYLTVCKTFEEEDSWKQDVKIFMIDVDEIRNDSIVLREVSFSRPVKQ